MVKPKTTKQTVETVKGVACSFRESAFMNPPVEPTIILADTKWRFEITQFDIDTAQKQWKLQQKNNKGTIESCDHAAACVIAQGVINGQMAGMTAMAQIGTRTAKIYVALGGVKYVQQITQYLMPENLKRAVEHFDKTGLWNLKPGFYWLLPYPKSKNRNHLRGKGTGPQSVAKKGKQDRFRAASTRRVLRIDKKLVRIVS